jgi:hypothetical protein
VPTFRLPNVSGGGSITVQGANLADAQQQAASQSGVTLAQQQAGGTFGANSLVNGGGGAATPTGPQGFNAQAADIAARVADNAAQQAYLRARLNLDTDIEANKKAQQAWQNTFDQAKFDFQKQIDAANVTGVYNGAPTLAAQAEQNKTRSGISGSSAICKVRKITGHTCVRWAARPVGCAILCRLRRGSTYRLRERPQA